MTTILVEEDLKIANNKFKTKHDLLEDLWDVFLSDEMQELVNKSKKEDFVTYEDFISECKV
jgi:hypothetical protein